MLLSSAASYLTHSCLAHADLLHFRALWIRKTMGCPTSNMGRRFLDFLVDTPESSQCSRADTAVVLPFHSVFSGVRRHNPKFFLNFMEDLILHCGSDNKLNPPINGRQELQSPQDLGVIRVSPLLRSLHRVPYAPLEDNDPFFALLDFPPTDTHLGSYVVNIPKQILLAGGMPHPLYPPVMEKHEMKVSASATPIGWMFGPIAEDNGATLVVSHVQGSTLWYDFPSTRNNQRVMNEHRVSGGGSDIAKIISHLENFQWILLSGPVTIIIDPHSYYGFLSHEASFHLIGWVSIPNLPL